mmetsp:Transcript_18850/g.40878  ORF Transcript_18850/g.40878 Transcript_18850/m.40878 type:complete len:1389 (-) Transcript_18850:61-4227(-)
MLRSIVLVIIFTGFTCQTTQGTPHASWTTLPFHLHKLFELASKWPSSENAQFNQDNLAVRIKPFLLPTEELHADYQLGLSVMESGLKRLAGETQPKRCNTLIGPPYRGCDDTSYCHYAGNNDEFNEYVDKAKGTFAMWLFVGTCRPKSNDTQLLQVETNPASPLQVLAVSQVETNPAPPLQVLAVSIDGEVPIFKPPVFSAPNTTINDQSEDLLGASGIEMSGMCKEFAVCRAVHASASLLLEVKQLAENPLVRVKYAAPVFSLVNGELGVLQSTLHSITNGLLLFTELPYVGELLSAFRTVYKTSIDTPAKEAKKVAAQVEKDYFFPMHGYSTQLIDGLNKVADLFWKLYEMAEILATLVAYPFLLQALGLPEMPDVNAITLQFEPLTALLDGLSAKLNSLRDTFKAGNAVIKFVDMLKKLYDDLANFLPSISFLTKISDIINYRVNIHILGVKVSFALSDIGDAIGDLVDAVDGLIGGIFSFFGLGDVLSQAKNAILNLVRPIVQPLIDALPDLPASFDLFHIPVPTIPTANFDALLQQFDAVYGLGETLQSSLLESFKFPFSDVDIKEAAKRVLAKALGAAELPFRLNQIFENLSLEQVLGCLEDTTNTEKVGSCVFNLMGQIAPMGQELHEKVQQVVKQVQLDQHLGNFVVGTAERTTTEYCAFFPAGTVECTGEGISHPTKFNLADSSSAAAMNLQTATDAIRKVVHDHFYGSSSRRLDEDCPGPYLHYDDCEDRMQWMLANWATIHRYAGGDFQFKQSELGTRCSIQQFLHEEENHCSPVPVKCFPFENATYPECENRTMWLLKNWDDPEYKQEGIDGSRCSIRDYLAKHEFCPQFAADTSPTPPTVTPSPATPPPSRQKIQWEIQLAVHVPFPTIARISGYTVSTEPKIEALQEFADYLFIKKEDLTCDHMHFPGRHFCTNYEVDEGKDAGLEFTSLLQGYELMQVAVKVVLSFRFDGYSFRGLYIRPRVELVPFQMIEASGEYDHGKLLVTKGDPSASLAEYRKLDHLIDFFGDPGAESIKIGPSRPLRACKREENVLFGVQRDEEHEGASGCDLIIAQAQYWVVFVKSLKLDDLEVTPDDMLELFPAIFDDDGYEEFKKKTKEEQEAVLKNAQSKMSESFEEIRGRNHPDFPDFKEFMEKYLKLFGKFLDGKEEEVDNAVVPCYICRLPNVPAWLASRCMRDGCKGKKTPSTSVVLDFDDDEKSPIPENIFVSPVGMPRYWGRFALKTDADDSPEKQEITLVNEEMAWKAVRDGLRKSVFYSSKAPKDAYKTGSRISIGARMAPNAEFHGGLFMGIKLQDYNSGLGVMYTHGVPSTQLSPETGSSSESGIFGIHVPSKLPSRSKLIFSAGIIAIYDLPLQAGYSLEEKKFVWNVESLDK